MTHFGAIVITLGLLANAGAIAYATNIYEKSTKASQVIELCGLVTRDDIVKVACDRLGAVEIAEQVDAIRVDERLRAHRFFNPPKQDDTEALPTVDFELEEIPEGYVIDLIPVE